MMLTELVVTRWETKVKDFAGIPWIDVDRVGGNTPGKTLDYKKASELEAVKLSSFISSSHATCFLWSITKICFLYNYDFLD